MKYKNKLSVPLLVKGVGEVAPGGEFETDLPVSPRHASKVSTVKKESK